MSHVCFVLDCVGMTNDMSKETIQPKTLLGLQREDKSNVYFTKDDSVIYLIEGCIIQQDYLEHKQQIYPLASSNEVVITSLNAAQNLLAVVEYDDTVKG